MSVVKRNQALSKTCLSLKTQAGPNLDFDLLSYKVQDKLHNRANSKLYL